MDGLYQKCRIYVRIYILVWPQSVVKNKFAFLELNELVASFFLRDVMILSSSNVTLSVSTSICEKPRSE